MVNKIKTYLYEYQWIVMTVSLLLIGWVSFNLTNNPIKYTESVPTSSSQLVSAPAKSTNELLAEDLVYIKSVSELSAVNNSNKDISRIFLQYQDSTLIYLVYYADNSIVAYNAITAEEVAYNGTADIDSDNTSVLPINVNPKISFADALTVVKNQSPDRPVIKMELTVQTAIVMYNAYFSQDDSLYVSASTGNIVTVPDPEPIQYTAAETTQPSTSVAGTSTENNTTNNKKRPSWSINKKKLKKLVQEYREYYNNRD